MRRLWKSACFATAVAGAAGAMPVTAQAAVSVGVSIGAPGFFYGAGFYPPGPCDAFDYYYSGYCGYPVFAGPIFINGIWLSGPHYYRWWGGQPVFWYRGGWHNWAGWRGAHVRWSHAAGWGWRNGRWNRAWGPRFGSAHFRSVAHWQGHPGLRRAAQLNRGRNGIRATHAMHMTRAAHMTRATHFGGHARTIARRTTTHFRGHMRSIGWHGGTHWRGRMAHIGWHGGGHFGGRSFGGAHFGGARGGFGRGGGGRRGH